MTRNHTPAHSYTRAEVGKTPNCAPYKPAKPACASQPPAQVPLWPQHSQAGVYTHLQVHCTYSGSPTAPATRHTLCHITQDNQHNCATSHGTAAAALLLLHCCCCYSQAGQYTLQAIQASANELGCCQQQASRCANSLSNAPHRPTRQLLPADVPLRFSAHSILLAAQVHPASGRGKTAPCALLASVAAQCLAAIHGRPGPWK